MTTLSDDQIKQMVSRFLSWRLPKNFNPDAGISFKPDFNEHTAHPMKHEPTGTNLFDATQAEEMIRYLAGGASAIATEQDAKIGAAYDQLREHDGRPQHKEIPVRVWADVDEGIADLVIYLNTIPGVRTDASCQGTIGEGGPAPYPAQVMAHWNSEADERLRKEFNIEYLGNQWGVIHPRAGWKRPETAE